MQTIDPQNPPAQDGVVINNPELKKTGGKLVADRKAITDGRQAYSIAKQLEENNRQRNDINSIVQKKYNGAQPHNPSELKANQEDWRNNFPTGFLSSIVDRVIPEPVQVVDSARYLTSACLYGDTEQHTRKTNFFREQVTKAIRKWNRWKSFNYALWTENVLHGAAIPACLDPFSPWPKLYRLDEAFVPEGTGQHAENVQVATFKEDLLIHEFLEPLIDVVAAEDAGWDVEACMKTADEALPQSQLGDEAATVNSRRHEDIIREGNAGAAHSGAKVIKLYHVLAVEPDTRRVTHYIVTRHEQARTLFVKEEQFEKMEDVLTLFTLQPGNGKFYSSRGLGRLLVNTHIAIERARMAFFDQLLLSGMQILHTDAGTVPSLQLKVRHPFILVSSDATFAEESIQSNAEAFEKADAMLARWAEQQVGSYITGLRSIEGGDSAERTATEASIEARRDQQAKIAFLARAWGQFADLVGLMTRRLCDPETEDAIAKELQKRLMEDGGLTRGDIKELANAPAAEVVQDLSQAHDSAIIQAFATLAGNPNIDQRELFERYLSALVDAEFARDIMLDDAGLQTIEAEAVRQQIIENAAIASGESVPVSPRDPHEMHLKQLFTELHDSMPGIMKNPHPKILDNASAALVHAAAHIKTWDELGGPPDVINQFENMLKAFDGALNQIAEGAVQQQSAQQQIAAQQAQQPRLLPGADQQAMPAQMSERTLIALIGQFQNLTPEEQSQLLNIAGMKASAGPRPSSIPADGQTAQPQPQPPPVGPDGSPLPPDLSDEESGEPGEQNPLGKKTQLEVPEQQAI